MIKQLILPALLITMVSTLIKTGAKEKPPLQVVSSVDLSRYAGLWYEIARLPNRFQTKCAGEVKANYTLLEDGRFKVVNQCRRSNGEMSQVEGVARLARKNGPNSKLKVRFAPSFLSFLPFVWGDYWILDLSPDYSSALIGEPNRRYLWILSRTPQMAEPDYQRIIKRAEAQGYDLSRLVKTRQIN